MEEAKYWEIIENLKKNQEAIQLQLEALNEKLTSCLWLTSYPKVNRKRRSPKRDEWVDVQLAGLIIPP